MSLWSPITTGLNAHKYDKFSSVVAGNNQCSREQTCWRCSVLCCSVWHCSCCIVSVWLLQCIVKWWKAATKGARKKQHTGCCSVLKCVLHGAAVCCSVLQCAAVYCSVLQCVAVCCSVLQRDTACSLQSSWSSRAHNKWSFAHTRLSVVSWKILFLCVFHLNSVSICLTSNLIKLFRPSLQTVITDTVNCNCHNCSGKRQATVLVVRAKETYRVA